MKLFRSKPPTLSKPIRILSLVLGGFLATVFAIFLILSAAKFGFVQTMLSFFPKYSASGTNILVVGVDEVENAQHSDTIVVVHIDDKNNQMGVLSIPRDTRVYIAGIGHKKINQAFSSGGILLLKDTVSSFLNMPIHHYVKIDLEGAMKIVDQVNGVEMDVDKDMQYVDQSAGLSIDIKKGKQVLNGENAAEYLRFRGGLEADIGRIDRQQGFLKSFLGKLFGSNNLFETTQKLQRLKSMISTDLSTVGMLRLTQSISKSFDSGNIRTAIVPGQPEMIGGISYWQVDIPSMDVVVNDVLFGFSRESIPKVEKELKTAKLASIAEPIQKPLEQPAQKPLEKPIKKPIQEPIKKPVEKAIEKPIETLSPEAQAVAEAKKRSEAELIARTAPKTLLEKPVATSKSQPVKKETEKPIKTELVKPVEMVVQKPVEKVVQKPLEATAKKPVEKIVQKPTETIVKKPVETTPKKSVQAVAQKPVEKVVQKPVETVSKKPVETVVTKPSKPVTEKPAQTTGDKKAVTPQETPRIVENKAPTKPQVVKPATSGPRIEVINGSGAPGSATKMGEFLKAKGFEVIVTDNANATKYPKTLAVSWKSDLQKTSSVAQVAGINPDSVVVYNRPDKSVDITIVMGQDWQALGFLKEVSK